jgi:hypothetical protein
VEGSWAKIGASFLVFVVFGLAVVLAATQVSQSVGVLYLAAFGVPVALMIGFGSRSSLAIPFLVTGCVYGAVLLPTLLLDGLQSL